MLSEQLYHVAHALSSTAAVTGKIDVQGKVA
jgi:hypothetical protein